MEVSSCRMNKSRNDPRHPAAQTEQPDVQVSALKGVSRRHKSFCKESS